MTNRLPPSPVSQGTLFLVSLVVYLTLALWMTNVWKPLGDEPHYLLAAHSLVADRDLNLANNYAAQDYNLFTGGGTLDPHVKILADGTQVLNHDLGLPFVIALPYALGGRLGVELFLATCAALLGLQMFNLAYDVTRSRIWSVVAWAALAFTPPLVLYATLIYPELAGALILVSSARTILFREGKDISPLRLATLSVGIAFLPWLSVRFVVLFTLLLAAIAVRRSLSRTQLLTCFAVAGLGFTAYLIVNQILLAGVVPKGNPTELAGGNLATLSPASLARGVLGWWIDPQRGTLAMAPIYIIALAGILRLVRASPLKGILLLSPLLVLVPLVAVLGGFWIPFEVGARYFVVALPLLVAPLALALESIFQSRTIWQRVAFGGLVGMLSGLSLWNGALMVTDASFAYGSVVSAYSRLVGTDVSPLFAGMGHTVVIRPEDVEPEENRTVATKQVLDGEPVWHVAPGTSGIIAESYELSELTVGHYAISFRARAWEGMHATALQLFVGAAEGPVLVDAAWNASALHSDSLQPITVEFDNPYFDRWGSSLALQMQTTGADELDVSALTFNPDNPTTWLRAGLWVAVILGIVLVFNLDLVVRTYHPFKAIDSHPRRRENLD